ncbi:MAG: CHAT domain-containing protein, partial [Acidobacteriaceae bacterium]|nr:CHAT domain-containing protein [Acidobacteriaceae bacterium]
ALPGAGVIGLSRAWLLAGAAGVIVSAWPTPDDAGSFFTAFYNHLRSSPGGPLAKRAAAALAQAQLDVRRIQGDSASSPWATYSIISKE